MVYTAVSWGGEGGAIPRSRTRNRSNLRRLFPLPASACLPVSPKKSPQSPQSPPKVQQESQKSKEVFVVVCRCRRCWVPPFRRRHTQVQTPPTHYSCMVLPSARVSAVDPNPQTFLVRPTHLRLSAALPNRTVGGHSVRICVIVDMDTSAPTVNPTLSLPCTGNTPKTHARTHPRFLSFFAQAEHSFIRSFVRSHLRKRFGRSVTRSLTRSFVRSCVRSCARSFVRSFAVVCAVGLLALCTDAVTNTASARVSVRVLLCGCMCVAQCITQPTLAN